MAAFEEIADVAKLIFLDEGGNEQSWLATDEVERNYFYHRAAKIIDDKNRLQREQR